MAGADYRVNRNTCLLCLAEVRRTDGCACRKPKPGLLTAAPAYALNRSILVGDRWRDIEAGRQAGCRALVFVDYGYDEPAPVDADTHVRSLAEAADWILKLEDET